MADSKKIKIYTTSNSFLKVGAGIKKAKRGFFENLLNFIFYCFYLVGLVFLKSFYFIKNTIVETCFHTGNFLFKSIVAFYLSAKNDIITTHKTFPKRIKLLAGRDFYRALFSFLIFALVAAGVLGGLNLAAQALGIKEKIMKTALVGNSYLNQAKLAVSIQDFNEANNRFALAYQTFNKGQSDIEESNQSLNKLLNLIPQKKDADRLLKSAQLISQAGQDFISLQNNIKNLKLTSAGISETEKPLTEIFSDSSENLDNIQNEISQASKNLNQIDINNLPKENHSDFLDIKFKLNSASTAINNFNQIFFLTEKLLMGDKKILILFENNNEIRASGGFMGTFGALSIKDGKLVKINVSSIYDLDGQLDQNIQPPKPILNINNRWFLRDSNWFASFPESAKKISSFYEKEGGETPDVIIALTPNLIVDWLKITGPIYLPNYKITLTADNFVEQTQAVTTLSNNLPTNSPKQILADLVPIILQKLGALDQSSWSSIIESFQNNLNNKQIVVYSRDPETQSQLEAFNWTGDLRDTNRDYLSVINSNLGGTKTDLFIDQDVTLNSSIDSEGYIINKLLITRTNRLPKLDKTINLDYLRVYVPLGSLLLENIGFDYKNNLAQPQENNFKIDEDVLGVEKNSVTDVVTGTTIGQEAGKTFFGNWLSLEGGETKTIKLSYKLPFKLNNIDQFSLMVQKQIGAPSNSFRWSFKFPGYQIAWKNFDPSALNTSDLNSDIILDKDNFFGMVLQKR